MKTYKRVFAKINLNYIETNLERMHALVGKNSRFFAVIKADGYGHCAVHIASFLENLDYVFGYAVATAEEALELRYHGLKKPILILGYTFPDCYEKLALHDIMPTVFRADSLKALSEAALKAGRELKVHIKVETGMNRIGISPDESGLSFVEQVLRTEHIVLDGMFTHFARADETDKSKAFVQLQVFNRFVELVKNRFKLKIPHVHCANSAAILELQESHMELVRAGIAMYGLWPSEDIRRDSIVLQPVLSLHSHIVFIKQIKPGDAVSYGGTFLAEKPMRIATIPVGYGDGYPRGLSGKGFVLIRGKKAPILGRICMDQFMVDVTEIPEAECDDPVTLIGRDGQEEITIETLGTLGGRFNYELACDLGRRIPRIYTYKEEIVAVKDFFAE